MGGKRRTWAVMFIVAASSFGWILTGCEKPPGGRLSQGAPNILIVNSTSPTPNDQNAYLDQPILIHFNQEVDPLTVNHGTIRVIGPGGTVNGTFSVRWAEVSFTPDVNFTPNTSYSVTVASFSSAPFCVLSMLGDGLETTHILNFQTGTQYTPDTDPPSVLGIWVSNGTSNVVELSITDPTVTMNISPATTIIVEFDEGMLQSSFLCTGTNSTFSLIDQTNPTNPINGSFRFFNKNSRVVFYPLRTVGDPFLKVGTNYTLLLTSQLQDDSLNPGPNNLAPAPIQVAFRTRNPIDLALTSTAVSGTFVIGETVTATGGATGTIKSISSTGGTTEITVDALTISGVFVDAENITGGASSAVANNILVTRQPYNGWNSPSLTSPYAEMFSSINMLDPNNTSAVWNIASAAQRLEGGYGAAALAGSGVDGPFNPTTSQALSTSTRPFGYNYTSIFIPSNVTISGAGINPLIIKSQGDVTIEGTISVDGNSGISTAFIANYAGTPGGQGGPGGFSGGSGNPPPGVTPIRSAGGSGPSGGQGGLWQRDRR
jgi:hypothetical protein